MTDREAAERARAQYAARLHALGAHAIAVERVRVGGRLRFAVVVMVDDPQRVTIPGEVHIADKRSDRAVPVVVQKAERFQLD